VGGGDHIVSARGAREASGALMIRERVFVCFLFMLTNLDLSSLCSYRSTPVVSATLPTIRLSTLHAPTATVFPTDPQWRMSVVSATVTTRLALDATVCPTRVPSWTSAAFVVVMGLLASSALLRVKSATTRPSGFMCPVRLWSSLRLTRPTRLGTGTTLTRVRSRRVSRVRVPTGSICLWSATPLTATTLP
jgi:hypothetical protein